MNTFSIVQYIRIRLEGQVYANTNMKIFVIRRRFQDTSHFTLEDIEPSDSIQSVKYKIEAKKGYKVKSQKIYVFDGRTFLQIGDDVILSDLNISYMAPPTLYLDVKRSEESQE